MIRIFKAAVFLDFRRFAPDVPRLFNVSYLFRTDDVGGHGKSLGIIFMLAFLPLILWL